MYLADAEELIRPERNTLTVSFVNIEQYNQPLATTIQEEYYRLHTHARTHAHVFVFRRVSY